MVCLAFAGMVAMYLYPRATRIDREHYDALAVGMTRKEVERVLGGPPRAEFYDRVTVWVPRDKTKISAEVRPGTPLPSFFPEAKGGQGDNELVWASDTGLIAGRFDSDGILHEKYFSDASAPKRPPLHRILRPISREAKFTPTPATSPPPAAP